MNLFNYYLTEIKSVICKVFSDIDFNNNEFFNKLVLEPPRNKVFGDMSTNAAMVLSSSLGIDPLKIASKIVEELKFHEDIKEVKSIKPGFINITFENHVWHNLLIKLLNNKKGWIYENFGKKQKINLEFVSANPTGPLHAGHARGAVFGDCLASILELVGYDVTREYYINDAGKQIDILVESSFLRYLEALGEKNIQITEGLYPGDYLKSVGLILKQKFDSDLKKLSFKEYFPKIKSIVLNHMLNNIKNDLKRLGVHIDIFTSETKIIESGKLDEVLNILIEKDLIYNGILDKPKGKSDEDWEPRPQKLFKSKLFGDDNDRALKKSDDSWTYFATDIAYHFDKIKRTKGDLINILGADHSGYVSRISSAVKAITDSKYTLTNKICSIVHLMESGEIIKMSKRSGKFITLSDVIKNVGKDVIRFMMLTRRNDQTLEFDFAKVREKSKENPVFYVHYAFARCKSIIKMSNISEEKIKLNSIQLLKNPHEINLIKLISQWPRVLETSAKYMEPHRICFYLIELASEFHSLWNKGKEDNSLKFINIGEIDLTNARMALIKSVSTTLESGLNILSIKPRDKM